MKDLTYWFATYTQSIKEFNMDTTLFKYLWQPFKIIGSKLSFLNNKWFYRSNILLLILGTYLDINTFNSHELLLETFVYVFASIALILLLVIYLKFKTLLIFD